MAEGQKIRLQIVYGSENEWNKGALSQFIPKIGELCADYDSAQLKIGNGKNTWSELSIVGDISYYSNQGHVWSMGSDTATYYIPHEDNNSNHALQINIPVGTGSNELAKGNHTHSVLNVPSQNFTLRYITSACTLQFNTSTTSLARIEVKPLNHNMNMSLWLNGANPIRYNFPSKEEGGEYTIALVEDMLPMPEIQMIGFVALPSTVTDDTGRKMRKYELKFRVVKGTIEEGDRIELCTTTLSTSKKHPNRRRYKMRAQWHQDINPNEDNIYICEMTDKDLHRCYKYPASIVDNHRTYYGTYPLYLRVRRPLNKHSLNDGFVFSSSVVKHIGRRVADQTPQGAYSKWLYSIR